MHVCVYQQHFFIFLLQSIEDRLKAINSASSETQRYVYVVIGVTPPKQHHSFFRNFHPLVIGEFVVFVRAAQIKT